MTQRQFSSQENEICSISITDSRLQTIDLLTSSPTVGETCYQFLKRIKGQIPKTSLSSKTVSGWQVEADDHQQGTREGDTGAVLESEWIMEQSVAGPWWYLPCRSIRIGNYKVLPKNKLTVNARGVHLKVPGISNTQEVVTIAIGMNDIHKVLAFFGKSMPLMFIEVTGEACSRIRQQLKMVNTQAFYLDVHSLDETQKRITILPEYLTDENKSVMRRHFASKLQELQFKDANKILLHTMPGVSILHLTGREKPP